MSRPRDPLYDQMEREVRQARRHRRNAAEDLAHFLGVPVAIDARWRIAVEVDGQAVPLRNLVPINVALTKKATQS